MRRQIRNPTANMRFFLAIQFSSQGVELLDLARVQVALLEQGRIGPTQRGVSFRQTGGLGLGVQRSPYLGPHNGIESSVSVVCGRCALRQRTACDGL